MLHKVTQLIAALPRRDVPAAELAAGKHGGGTPARGGDPSAVRPAGQRGQPGTAPETAPAPAPAPLRTAPRSSAGLPWPLPASLLPTLPFLLKKPTNSQPCPVPSCSRWRDEVRGYSRPDSARVPCLGRTWHRPPSTAASLPHLNHVVVEVLGVSVDQVDLFGVHVAHRLFAQLICHHLVVGLVDIALLPDGRRVQKALRGAEGARREGRAQQRRGGQGRAGPGRSAQGGRAGEAAPCPAGSGMQAAGGPTRLFNRGLSPHPRRARRRLQLPPPGGPGPAALPQGGASGPSAGRALA